MNEITETVAVLGERYRMLDTSLGEVKTELTQLRKAVEELNVTVARTSCSAPSLCIQLKSELDVVQDDIQTIKQWHYKAAGALLVIIPIITVAAQKALEKIL